MPMKPKMGSSLAPKTSKRPKDSTEARAGRALDNMMRPGGATDREGQDLKSRTMPSRTVRSSGAVSSSPRSKKNPKY